jgi:ABC-type phosphate transport system permease subunit
MQSKDITTNWFEAIITQAVRISGYSAIVFVGLIFYFLISEGLPTIGEVPLHDLLSIRWYPIENYFGILH